MIHKGRSLLAPALVLALFSGELRAERRSVTILETSSSGKLVRLSVGARNGLVLGEAVLLSSNGQKVAAGRAIRVEDVNSVVVLLEKYGQQTPSSEAEYDLLYGEPFPEADNLPDYVADREGEVDNPQNEKFWVENRQENPELGDDEYTPEVAIRPKFPSPRTFTPHNVTVGLGIFRNGELPTSDDSEGNTIDYEGKSTYNGYWVRYAYTFRTNYWLKLQAPALISVEFGVGMYNFDHTFPASIRPDPADDVAQVRVIPIHVGARYLFEVSKVFRLYPYLGYQYNIVGAVNGSLIGLEPLMGGRLLGGVGAVLVMSNTVDFRVEGGTDGVLMGLVVKF